FPYTTLFRSLAVSMESAYIGIWFDYLLAKHRIFKRNQNSFSDYREYRIVTSKEYIFSKFISVLTHQMVKHHIIPYYQGNVIFEFTSYRNRQAMNPPYFRSQCFWIKVRIDKIQPFYFGVNELLRHFN